MFNRLLCRILLSTLNIEMLKTVRVQTYNFIKQASLEGYIFYMHPCLLVCLWQAFNGFMF